MLLGKLLGANMNVTTDQAIALAGADCVVTEILVTKASISLTTAAGGFYSAAAKGGTAIVAAGQTYAALTANTLAMKPAIAALLRGLSQIFFSLTTAQGAAATADIYVYGYLLDQGQA